MTEDEILFTSILNCKREDLYISGLSLSQEQAAKLSSAKRSRLEKIPLQYILGETEFFGLIFKVDKRVFIPRPETEILVEEAIKQSHNVARLRGYHNKIRIMDIGTGSGCIAVSLAKNLECSYISALDISAEALDVARRNAAINGVIERIEFIKSDLFLNTNLKSKEYDMIISNPPYIASSDIDTLPEEVKYEPAIALDGRDDGLYFYRAIALEAGKFLRKDGLLLMEMGFNQAGDIKNILQKSGNFEIISTTSDYCGIERVIIARSID